MLLAEHSYVYHLVALYRSQRTERPLEESAATDSERVYPRWAWYRHKWYDRGYPAAKAAGYHHLNGICLGFGVSCFRSMPTEQITNVSVPGMVCPAPCRAVVLTVANGRIGTTLDEEFGCRSKPRREVPEPESRSPAV